MQTLSSPISSAQNVYAPPRSGMSEKLKAWLAQYLPIAVAFLFIILVAFILKFVEMHYVAQTVRTLGAVQVSCPAQAISSLMYDGYLDDRPEIRGRYFICAEESEQVSWFRKVFGVKQALAADYSASKIIQSVRYLEIRPGETKEFTVGFKNTGTITWTRDGRNYISIYTHDPKYRTSIFQDTSWKLREQPARMNDASVAPGHVGYVTWKFRAPANLKAGWYEETFWLAAEDLLWIPGGQFTVKIYVDGEAVSSPTPTVTAQPVSPTPTTTAEPEFSQTSQPEAVDAEGYETKLLLKSHQSVTLSAGETVTYTAGFKNYGSAIWTSEKIVLPDVSTASALDNFYHSSWVSNSVVSVSDQRVEPGWLGFFKFTIKAPSRPGNYSANFKLVANDVTVPGGMINIPITVTDDGSYTPPATGAPVATLGTEPIMRIGLYDIESDLLLTADKSFKVVTSNGQDLGTYSAGEVVTTGYDKTNRQYYFSKGAKSYRGSHYIRFLPVGSGQNIFELVNYEHRPAWNRSYNDNKFRGAIEIRVSDTGYPWVINELPMEDYLKGLAETSNYSPLEFQKALVTAARSYAFHHYENPYKHAKGHFTLDATYDQVYRGYGSEIRVPRLAEAVEATRGMIVHYQDEAVFTPYYSRSDGRTRSYKEVWGIYNGSDYGWLQSVPAPYDKAAGNTLWGHGVGMACTDAIGMANDGKNWQEILKHYYTGITLRKLW